MKKFFKLIQPSFNQMLRWDSHWEAAVALLRILQDTHWISLAGCQRILPRAVQILVVPGQPRRHRFHSFFVVC